MEGCIMQKTFPAFLGNWYAFVGDLSRRKAGGLFKPAFAPLRLACLRPVVGQGARIGGGYAGRFPRSVRFTCKRQPPLQHLSVSTVPRNPVGQDGPGDFPEASTRGISAVRSGMPSTTSSPQCGPLA